MTYPSSFQARSVADKRQLAQRYAQQFGMAAFPVRGKVPLVAEWTTYREKSGLYGTETDWSQATGYALAPVQGTSLAVLDVDDPAASQSLLAEFPSLAETFQVHRSDHVHFYLCLADPLSQAGLKRWNHTPKREVASLRGTGMYVVGPLSDHPEGDLYIPNEQPIIRLNIFEQTRLLEWFAPSRTIVSGSPDGVQAVRVYPTQDEIAGEQTAVAQILRGRGYHLNKEWLNGPCIHPENHAHADKHPSFGVNIESGVGHCFACGNYAPAEVAAALELRTAPPRAVMRPYVFVMSTDQPRLESDGETVLIELNTTLALIREGKHAAARLNNLLFAHSRLNNGQHTYQIESLVELGQEYGLSRTQVTRAAATLYKTVC